MSLLSVDSSNVKRFGDIVVAVKDVTGLPLMISPGVLEDDMLIAFGRRDIDLKFLTVFRYGEVCAALR